jgi:hypothetical protein
LFLLNSANWDIAWKFIILLGVYSRTEKFVFSSSGYIVCNILQTKINEDEFIKGLST